MKPPKPAGHIQVLHARVPVYIVASDHAVLQANCDQLRGAYLPDDATIWLNGALSLDQLRETFMHEVMHAAITLAAIAVPREEHTVNHLSPVLCGTLMGAGMLRWPRWLKPIP